jgi:hypothetical protein
MKQISYHAAILTVILIAAYIFHFISLSQTEYANGWDSYFYLLQVKSLLEYGHLVSSRISLIYPLLAVCKWITGDYVVGLKVFIAMLSSVSVLLIYLNVSELTKDSNAALASAFFALCSPQLFYFSAQYPKNLLGFVCFLLFLLFLFRKKYYIMFGLLLLNILAHKLTGLLSVAVFGLYAIEYVFIQKKRAVHFFWGAIPIAVAICFPKLFGVDDFSRQLDLFTLSPQWGFIYFFNDFQGLISAPWSIEMILVICIAIAIVLLLFYKKCCSFNLWLLPLMFIALNNPFIIWDINGFSFRFYLFSFLLGPLLVGIAIAQFNQTKLTHLFSFVFFGSTFFTYLTYNPKIHDPAYHQYQQIVNQLEHSEILSQAELIIAHKGLAEFIKFTTNKDAMSWLPEYHIHEDSLWRITSGIRKHRLASVIPKQEIISLGNDYFLVTEKDWQMFLFNVKIDNPDFIDDYTDWKNPNEMRPAFLLKYKRKTNNNL